MRTARRTNCAAPDSCGVGFVQWHHAEPPGMHRVASDAGPDGVTPGTGDRCGSEGWDAGYGMVRQQHGL